jgi:predicted transcriptional regulator with HTH domain
MQLHIQYLRSLEESEVRKACLTYVQSWYHNFPSRMTGSSGGVAGLGGATPRPPGAAPPALEVCLDEAGARLESCEMGLVDVSRDEGFVAKALGQSAFSFGKPKT